MTNEELLEDLKQFITTSVRREVSDSEDRVVEKIKTSLGTELHLRIDDLDAKVDTILETVGVQLIDHDSRITKLEQAAA
jgi:hypothetical protein